MNCNLNLSNCYENADSSNEVEQSQVKLNFSTYRNPALSVQSDGELYGLSFFCWTWVILRWWVWKARISDSLYGYLIEGVPRLGFGCWTCYSASWIWSLLRSGFKIVPPAKRS